jgi:hypothetical protein
MTHQTWHTSDKLIVTIVFRYFLLLALGNRTIAHHLKTSMRLPTLVHSLALHWQHCCVLCQEISRFGDMGIGVNDFTHNSRFFSYWQIQESLSSSIKSLAFNMSNFSEDALSFFVSKFMQGMNATQSQANWDNCASAWVSICVQRTDAIFGNPNTPCHGYVQTVRILQDIHFQNGL